MGPAQDRSLACKGFVRRPAVDDADRQRAPQRHDLIPAQLRLIAMIRPCSASGLDEVAVA
jgi:hypothetical protein